ncbi:MAG: hypothetical protein PWQ52_1574 [Methanolobus sp.]|nr:hypothetical protein [Methanolobus sp.]
MKGQGILHDTRAIDTVPLKMVFYLVLTGTIIFLTAASWNSISPFFTGYNTEDQINDLSVELLSIQNGHARNLLIPGSIEGSMCTVRLSLPENVRFLALGVDPDPDTDGNLSNSLWLPENNTILVQYDSGHRNRFIIKGENMTFRQGSLNAKGNWVIDPHSVHDNLGIVIERPVNGDYVFELVLSDRKYTLSRF